MKFNGNNSLIAVSRFSDHNLSMDFALACSEGGIEIIEVIVIRPGAYDLIKSLSELENIFVGAGTVLDLESAKKAHNAGAKFLVSPHTDSNIIEYAGSNGLISVAGAYTSSEIVNAHKLGADYVKIFPASSGGPGYIKAIKEALPFVDILVTGGINIQNVNEYLNAGASVAGISTALCSSVETVDRKDVSDNARKFVEVLNSGRDL